MVEESNYVKLKDANALKTHISQLLWAIIIYIYISFEMVDQKALEVFSDMYL